MNTAYSGTPLAQKLGYKRGMKLFSCGMPPSVKEQLDPDSLGMDLLPSPIAGIEAAHIFETDRAQLERKLTALRQLLQPSGFVWASWPRQSTMVTEETVRAIALPMGFVDVERCAVDDTWSALKLMVRKDLRG